MLTVTDTGILSGATNGFNGRTRTKVDLQAPLELCFLRTNPDALSSLVSDSASEANALLPSLYTWISHGSSPVQRLMLQIILKAYPLASHKTHNVPFAQH